MKRKEQAEVEPRSCQETNKRRETQQKQEENRKETKNNEERKKRKQTKTQPSQQHKRNRRQASEKLLFDTVVEGSDAESKVGQRLSGRSSSLGNPARVYK